MAAKKATPKQSARAGDQYMIRMPTGLRDRIATRAEENGRSVSAEIVDAIEKHLKGTDRITQLWDQFEKHPIDLMWAAIEELERGVSRLTGDPPGLLTQKRLDRERLATDAAEQAKQALLKADVEAVRKHARTFEERIRAAQTPEKQKDPPA
jgi:hypothetical protein